MVCQAQAAAMASPGPAARSASDGDAMAAGAAYRWDDAALHADLGRVAADARARFEDALEQLELHEGLLLPSPAA
jgi:hypothetical protein